MVAMSEPAAPVPRRGFSGMQVLGLIALAIALSAGATYWFIRT
jgi:hypothetical protein